MSNPKTPDANSSAENGVAEDGAAEIVEIELIASDAELAAADETAGEDAITGARSDAEDSTATAAMVAAEENAAESAVPETTGETPTAEIVETAELNTIADGKDDTEPVIPFVRNPAQGRAALECLLFLAVEPVSLKRLCKHLPPLTEKELRALIVELQNLYDERGSGLQILELGGGFQMATRSSYSPWVMSMQKIRKRPALSPAALETLAIIAYKQPVTRAELEAIRGVDSSSLIRMLQEIEFVTVTGHKEVVGRPQLYGTTKKFLKAFGLASLNDLPSIAELKMKFGLKEN